MVKANSGFNGNGDLNFTSKLWQAADKMRNNMDAAEYKHVVLGLIFLKYISDSFTELYDKLIKEGKNDLSILSATACLTQNDLSLIIFGSSFASILFATRKRTSL